MTAPVSDVLALAVTYLCLLFLIPTVPGDQGVPGLPQDQEGGAGEGKAGPQAMSCDGLLGCSACDVLSTV